MSSGDLGSRQVRLRLTENRFRQKADFTELLSKNEDADIVDTIILYCKQMIYNASLMASSKVSKFIVGFSIE